MMMMKRLKLYSKKWSKDSQSIKYSEASNNDEKKSEKQILITGGAGFI
jgi:hypothetical protein